MAVRAAHGVDSLADQRYYHFVALKESNLTFQGYWQRFPARIRHPTSALNVRDARVTLQHRKLISTSGHARGAVATKLSELGKGEPPFYYDLIAMRAEVAGEAFFLIGFPFASLARDLFKNYLGMHRVPGSGKFVSADVGGLVLAMETGFKQRYEALNVHTVGVQFAVSDDKYLSNIRLGGDDPLAAEVYQDFLKSRLKRGFVLPDRCSLACERLWTSTDSQPARLLRSRIHFNNYGNFRVYAQAGCGNLLVLPYALGQLQAAGLLKPVSQNPLLRVDEEQTE